MTALLFLIFIGQGMASLVTLYTMDITAMGGDRKHQYSESIKACSKLAQIDGVSSVKVCAIASDCCTAECLCQVSGCSTSSSPALATVTNSQVIIELSDKILTNSFFVPQQILTSLYKPPIVS